jgi:radical SAM superfamily enzyme YgiQ (UPF0313 family)
LKILLVYPYYSYSTVSTFEEPLGVLYLASALLRSGHDVDVMDLTFNKEMEGLDTKVRWADVVGISAPTPLFGTADTVLKYIKKLRPDITTIVGGPHATANPLDALNAGFDYAIIGEGEITIVELVGALESGMSVDDVSGIVYKHEDEIIKTETRQFVADLNEIAFPARQFIDYSRYRRLGVISMRGCPYRCIYCKPVEEKLFGKKLRRRSVENVIEELEELISRYGNRPISFKDDTLTVNKSEWFEVLGETFRRKNIHLTWQCSSRVDTVDLEKLRAMKKAGCRQIFFGIESGSQRILDFYKKGTTVEQIIETFEMCHQVGIRPAASIMLGAPIEKREDMEKTYELVKKIKPFNWHVHVTTPICGSYLYDQAIEEKRIDSTIDYERCAPTGNIYNLHLPMKLDNLSVEDIAEYRERINKYMKFRVLINCLSDVTILKEFLFSKGLRTIVFNFVLRHFNPFKRIVSRQAK